MDQSIRLRRPDEAVDLEVDVIQDPTVTTHQDLAFQGDEIFCTSTFCRSLSEGTLP